MLATTSWPTFSSSPLQQQQQQPYLPPRPSPLSPRSANACPPRLQFWSRHAFNMSMTSSRDATPGSENEAMVPFAKRDIKTNPVMKKARQAPDEARERRRDIFMKKVEKGRDEKRWGGRSEQILRSDYMAQRRKWEEDRDREAQNFLDYEDEDSEHALPMLPPRSPRLHAQPDDEQQVDEIAQIEEQELRALLEMQQQQQQQQQAQEAGMQTQNIPSSPTHYGSDDDDFDDIFMELVSSQQQPLSCVEVRQQDAEMMDMS